MHTRVLIEYSSTNTRKFFSYFTYFTRPFTAIFYFFKKTNRSLEKRLESFYSFDSFNPKHNYASPLLFFITIKNFKPLFQCQTLLKTYVFHLNLIEIIENLTKFMRIMYSYISSHFYDTCIISIYFFIANKFQMN